MYLDIDDILDGICTHISLLTGEQLLAMHVWTTLTRPKYMCG